ncbi:MAG: thiamine pyrophosphate-dependent enzyme [Candidatus Angelobacter sp.]
MASKTRGGEVAEKNAHPATASSATSSLLHGEKLKQLHATMVKCRRAQKRFHGGHAAKGRSSAYEAVVAGTVFDLLPDDYVAPSLLGTLARSISDVAPAHPSGAPKRNDPAMKNIVNQLAVATGMALALKEGKARNIAVLLAGELGPASKGYDELLRFAAGRKLPVIYLLQTASGSERLRIQAQKCGLPGIIVDGSDAVAVLRVMQECTRRARQGHGPSLVAYQLSADPLALMEAYLRKRRLWP